MRLRLQQGHSRFGHAVLLPDLPSLFLRGFFHVGVWGSRVSGFLAFSFPPCGIEFWG